jgi:D-hexose-6-phosphate mutarotase|tara:strand:- start:5455 stop:5850 length:396 start_codon:yes stop_codon:yes gene_type:complete
MTNLKVMGFLFGSVVILSYICTVIKQQQVNLIMEKEFKINDIVTLDRYNHIEDVQRVKVVGFGEMLMSKTLTYKMDVNGTIIESTGGSIMESKNYKPVDDKDRHHRLKASVIEIEEYWDRKRCVVQRNNDL